MPIDISSLTIDEYCSEVGKYSRCLSHALDGEIDIEMDDCCLRGLGTIEQRKMYRNAWQETYDTLKVSRKLNEWRPEFHECMGYTKEEYEKMSYV